MQIEDKVYDIHISIPEELAPDMKDIYDFIIARLQKLRICSCNSKLDYWAECVGPLQFLSSVFFYRQKRKIVLSRIRDIVSAPDFIPSSIAPVIETCVTHDAFSPAEFSNLLQTPIIEGHTAMYWAVVNHRREALSAFAVFIPRFSSVCFDDLRLACMIINDHASFAQLNFKLGPVIDSKDEPLRRLLNCPPDEVQVQTGDRLSENKFTVCFRFRMFQKRLRMAHVLTTEFVAGDMVWRIWVAYFCTTPSMIGWYVTLRLSRHSSPARPEIVLVIKAHGGVKPGWGRVSRPQDLRVPHNNSKGCTLAPKK
ncbi:hypothetical protein BDR03DRAFT_1005192 [Suillus americanus]|nr:hypothetical protein BDR03DRAFT_1005192 [Suillus americanus]